jgi:2-hydroxy-3-oxopropionate reductase
MKPDSTLPRRLILGAMKETIGFIGLGLMGRPMARNLLKAGYPVVVHSRSRPPVDDLVSAGAAAAASPVDVARQATRIITMVPDSPDVELVLDGPNGVFIGMQPGTIVIDMSSITPEVTRRLAERARALGGAMLDAPVSGGEIGAVQGTLSIMVGGDAADFMAVKPILDVMGNPDKVVHIGESGAGQLCKLCNQMVIGGTLAVVAEALALARKANVDAAKVREALLGGFAQSRVLEVHGERALKGTFKPGFKTHLYAKDMRNVVSTLAQHTVAAPVTAVVQQMLHATMAAGHGEDDNSVMAKTVFEWAGLR